MTDLFVKSGVKAALANYNALDEEVTKPLEAVAQRAEANDRKTVQPRDL